MIFPAYISIKDWTASLLVDYPNERIPRLVDEDKWAEFGAKLAGIGIFSRANIPNPLKKVSGLEKDSFESWQQWAKAVYLIMMNFQDI